MLLGAPALGGPLLEEPKRVPVAVFHVYQARFLHRGSDPDRRREGREAAARGNRGHERGVVCLFGDAHIAVAIGGDSARAVVRDWVVVGNEVAGRHHGADRGTREHKAGPEAARPRH